MKLSRINLADIRAPTKLAESVHKEIGQKDEAIPVVDIARALDIEDLQIREFDGFEGMLLTDRIRSRGAILANTRNGRRRARFTVAHELGHFLMEHHELSADAGFWCRAADMREHRQDRRHHRQESQANRFAIELLAPAYKVEPLLGEDPDLRSAQRLRDVLDISLEASVRRYVETHTDPLAAIWSHNGQIRYFARGLGFPWINRSKGTRLAPGTPAARAVTGSRTGFTKMAEVDPMVWSDEDRISELFEQTRIGADGHAVTLLWATVEEDGEEDGLSEISMPGFR